MTPPRGGRPFIDTWRRAVRDSQLRPPVRLVLLVLATYMDSDGSSGRPGVARLAAGTGLSDRSIKSSLAEAVAAGWLEQVVAGGSQKGGRRLASEYSARVPGRLTPARDAPVSRRDPPHGGDGQPPRPGNLVHRSAGMTGERPAPVEPSDRGTSRTGQPPRPGNLTTADRGTSCTPPRSTHLEDLSSTSAVPREHPTSTTDDDDEKWLQSTAIAAANIRMSDIRLAGTPIARPAAYRAAAVRQILEQERDELLAHHREHPDDTPKDAALALWRSAYVVPPLQRATRPSCDDCGGCGYILDDDSSAHPCPACTERSA